MIKAEEAKKIANIKNEIERELEIIEKRIKEAAKKGEYFCTADVEGRIVSEIFSQLKKYDYKVSASGYEQDDFVELIVRW